VSVVGRDLDVVLKRVPVLGVAAEVAHHVPAARGGQPHRLPARASQPHGQPVLQWPRRDRGGALDREELPVEREVPLRQREVQQLKALSPGPLEIVVAQVPAGRELYLAGDPAPEAEFEPAAAEQVKRPRLLGNPDRAVEREHGHRGT
jgi:hypothetical protein